MPLAPSSLENNNGNMVALISSNNNDDETPMTNGTLLSETTVPIKKLASVGDLNEQNNSEPSIWQRMFFGKRRKKKDKDDEGAGISNLQKIALGAIMTKAKQQAEEAERERQRIKDAEAAPSLPQKMLEESSNEPQEEPKKVPQKGPQKVPKLEAPKVPQEEPEKMIQKEPKKVPKEEPKTAPQKEFRKISQKVIATDRKKPPTTPEQPSPVRISIQNHIIVTKSPALTLDSLSVPSIPELVHEPIMTDSIFAPDKETFARIPRFHTHFKQKGVGDGGLDGSGAPKMKRVNHGCYFPVRFVILFISLLALTMGMAQPLIFNMGIVCMEQKTIFTSSNDSRSSVYHGPTYVWNEGEKLMVLSAAGWGMAMAVLPSIYFVRKFGAKIIFTATTLFAAVATLYCPLAAAISLPFLVFMRVIQGIGFTASATAIADMSNRWAPADEVGAFMITASMSLQLSTIVVSITTGFLCNSVWGWHWAFYSCGAGSFVTALIFVIIYKDDPAKHRWISDLELTIIYEDKPEEKYEAAQEVRCQTVLTPTVMMTIAALTSGAMFVLQFLNFYLPAYMVHMLKYNVKTAGFLSTLPAVEELLVKAAFAMCFCCAGFKTWWCNVTIQKLRLLNTGYSLLIVGACVGLTYIDNDDNHIYPLCLFAALGLFLGIGYVGCLLRCVEALGVEHGTLLLGVAQVVTGTAASLIPFFIGPVVYKGTFEDWRNVFYATIAVVCTGNVCFLIMGRPKKLQANTEATSSATGKAMQSFFSLLHAQLGVGIDDKGSKKSKDAPKGGLPPMFPMMMMGFAAMSKASAVETTEDETTSAVAEADIKSVTSDSTQQLSPTLSRKDRDSPRMPGASGDNTKEVELVTVHPSPTPSPVVSPKSKRRSALHNSVHNSPPSESSTVSDLHQLESNSIVPRQRRVRLSDEVSDISSLSGTDSSDVRRERKLSKVTVV